MRRFIRLGQRAAVGLAVNLALWGAVLSFSPRAADDPLFRGNERDARAEEARKTSGMTFELNACFDCPEFVLLGREVPMDPTSAVMVLVNLPPILAARGAELVYGIRELRPWVLVAGMAVQWLGMLAAWEAWCHARQRRPRGHMTKRRIRATFLLKVATLGASLAVFTVVCVVATSRPLRLVTLVALGCFWILAIEEGFLPTLLGQWALGRADRRGARHPSVWFVGVEEEHRRRVDRLREATRENSSLQ